MFHTFQFVQMGWTSSRMDHYLGITCHFLDAQFRLNSSILRFAFCSSGKADVIAPLILKSMQAFGIESKVSCLTTDNAFAMSNAAGLASLPHLPCFVHTLQLAVNEALSFSPVVVQLVASVKRIVRYFKSSYVGKGRLTETFQSAGLKIDSLVQCVDTWWNSVYDMLERYLEVQVSVEMVLRALDKSNLVLPEGANVLAKLLVKELSECKDITLYFSTATSISASRVIPRIIKLLDALNVAEPSLRNNSALDSLPEEEGVLTGDAEMLQTPDDELEESAEVLVISTHQATECMLRFASSLRSAIARRLSPLLGNTTLLKATFLDPETHMALFHYCARSVGPYGLPEASPDSLYVSTVCWLQQELLGIRLAEMFKDDDTANCSMAVHLSKLAHSEQTRQFQACGLTLRRFCEDMNPMLRDPAEILENHLTAAIYFQRQTGHPSSSITVSKELSLLARKYLCCMASSVSVEREFSLSGLVLNDLRTSLGADLAEAQIFGKDNIEIVEFEHPRTKEACVNWDLRVRWNEPVFNDIQDAYVKVDFEVFGTPRRLNSIFAMQRCRVTS
eukprot:ANDGO_01876.mRNA.1 hypothetical protein